MVDKKIKSNLKTKPIIFWTNPVIFRINPVMFLKNALIFRTTWDKIATETDRNKQKLTKQAETDRNRQKWTEKHRNRQK